MKTKKNKKFYNFTEKQKRRDRSIRAFNHNFGSNAPASYRKVCNDAYNIKCKRIVDSFKKYDLSYVYGLFENLDDDFENITFPLFKKDMNWTYW